MTPRHKGFELFFWMTVPGIICITLFIICLVPKHLGGFSAFMPLLPIIPIFYWGVLQAREIPYWLVFILGLVSDAASGMPLGLSAMLYVFFLAAVHAQHKYIYKEGFVIIWGYFALLLTAMFALQWLFMSFSGVQLHALGPVSLQWFFTICCYPLFHKIFNILSEHINMRRWKIIHA